MSSWSKSIEDKFLDMRMQEYNKHHSRSHDNKLITTKTKLSILIVGIAFVVFSFIEMVLITISLLSTYTITQLPTGSQSGSLNLLWTFTNSSSQASPLGQITYNLTPYAIAIIFIGSAMIVSLFSFAYSLIKDDYYLSIQNSKIKKQFLITLFGSLTAFIIFIILGFIGISPLGAPGTIAEAISKAQPNHEFSLSFKFNTYFMLVPTGFAIFVSVLQIFLFVLSIPWLLGFATNINWSKFRKKHQ